MAVVLLLGGVVLLSSAGADSVLPSGAASSSGRLYFTTFHPASVESVSFAYRKDRLELSRATVVARPPGADGVLFGADGRLIVGGLRTGNVYAVDPSTGATSAVATGVKASMHLALSPDGGTLYTSAEPGELAALPASPLGPGHPVALHGATTIVTALAFGPGGQTLYTDSNPLGRGTIGLVDLSTGTTRRLLTSAGAHGIVYDPWSRSYIVVGGDVALQLAASDPGRIESEIVLRGNRFDQAAVTGRGQVLIASNLGSIVLIDYSRTGRIGDIADTVIHRYVARHLDDVAPLIGPGARPVATSAPLRRLAGGASVGTGAFLFGGFTALWGVRAQRKRRRERPAGRPLPRWDRRRR